ncbi:MAG: hypothetical protein HZA50_10645 [Planctomycetes bacterium]|nr:hypothetical protein [Planctomycetota bacterium]
MGPFAYFDARRHLRELNHEVAKGVFLADSGRLFDAANCYRKAKAERNRTFQYFTCRYGQAVAEGWQKMSAHLLVSLGHKVEA